MSNADDQARRAAGVFFPPDCDAVVRALWDYLDRALDAPTMAAIDAHLVRCVYCREHAEFERTLIQQIQGLRLTHTEPGTLRLRVLSALYDAGMPRH